MISRIEAIKDRRAREEYEAIKGFYIHVLVFICVNLLLVTVNVLIGGAMWAQWPILGWGLGVAAHAYAAFVDKPKRMAEWEARQMAQLEKEGMKGA